MTRHVTTMTLDDAEHYTPAKRAEIIESYPEHERDARSKGIPTFGSGLVFPITDESITVEPFAIPKHWPQIAGVDFGYDHPFGATRNAWDREADVWYVTAAFAERLGTPVTHAAAIRPWGDWLPIAWPHDGLQHDKGSGLQLAAQYRAQGLDEMLPEHATHEDGGNGIEAGIIEMLDRMKTGRWKVFKGAAELWLAEKRLYHRDKGIIVKERDDVISSSRYALMMRRFAITKPNASRVSRGGGSGREQGWLG